MKLSLNPVSQPRYYKTTKALVLLAAAGFATEQVQARPLGIDVSHYQGTVNWSSVKSAGRSFAWAKATEGASTGDSTFTANESNGKAAGVIMGAYHFAHPESNSGGTEENHFWAVAGGYIKADGKTLMPMLDVEVFSGHVGATSYSDWANQFNNALVADANAAGVRITPFIYTSSCSACNFNSSVSGWNADLANYNGESSQTGSPWNVCTSCEAWGTGVWDTWQYTDSASVSGVSGGVDADVVNGSSVSPYVATGNGAWHTWETLGGVFTANIASCSWAANRLDILGVGTDGQIYHKWWDGSAWQPSKTGAWQVLPFGAGWHGDIGAVSWGTGRIDFFVLGANNHCYHGWYDSSVGWQGMEDRGGVFVGTTGFGASSWASGRLDVFGVGVTASNLYHMWYDAGWSGWQNLGGTVTQTPGAVSWGANRIDVFVVDTSSQCKQMFYDGTQWNGFVDLNGVFAPYGFGASSMAYRQLDVFGVGVNSPNVVYDLTFNGSWGSWTSRGDSGTSTPSATSWSPGRIDLFVRGSDNSCHHNFFQ
ncbi:MAG: GH25 family lysozyme [Limisphaerales bacterium]